ncbi:unnamed protein product [Owenia fusiformis]|uniref:Uncharacterized protein n=1 Tax=Owenia fusiformis TaxID=6347 RepID=A0A8J1THW1_OWEFU|nr:unnamed protein product [Owenia fusiformis]
MDNIFYMTGVHANLEYSDICRLIPFNLTTQDATRLLHNKFIVIMGDSNQRSVYKDLVFLCQNNQWTPESKLAKKGELSFENDELIEGGELGLMINEPTYREVRQYTSQNLIIRFYFITRAYSDYMETILEDLESGPQPDLILINSCLWDMTRYGMAFMDDYRSNLIALMEGLNRVLQPNSLVTWATALPVSDICKGGPIRPELKFQRGLLNKLVNEANAWACEIVPRYGCRVLDFNLYSHMQKFRIKGDGIHWNSISHRRISNLLINNVSVLWKYMGRPFGYGTPNLRNGPFIRSTVKNLARSKGYHPGNFHIFDSQLREKQKADLAKRVQSPVAPTKQENDPNIQSKSEKRHSSPINLVDVHTPSTNRLDKPTILTESLEKPTSLKIPAENSTAHTKQEEQEKKFTEIVEKSSIFDRKLNVTSSLPFTITKAIEKPANPSSSLERPTSPTKPGEKLTTHNYTTVGTPTALTEQVNKPIILTNVGDKTPTTPSIPTESEEKSATLAKPVNNYSTLTKQAEKPITPTKPEEKNTSSLKSRNEYTTTTLTKLEEMQDSHVKPVGECTTDTDKPMILTEVLDKMYTPPKLMKKTSTPNKSSEKPATPTKQTQKVATYSKLVVNGNTLKEQKDKPIKHIEVVEKHVTHITSVEKPISPPKPVRTLTTPNKPMGGNSCITPIKRTPSTKLANNADIPTTTGETTITPTKQLQLETIPIKKTNKPKKSVKQQHRPDITTKSKDKPTNPTKKVAKPTTSENPNSYQWLWKTLPPPTYQRINPYQQGNPQPLPYKWNNLPFQW